MPQGLLAATALQRLTDDAFSEQGVALWCKREDLRHPLYGGNKWHKLQGHLQRAQAQDAKAVLSFGGAWSNHLYALAAVGQDLGIKTIGLVRGPNNTAMLDDCRGFGMTIKPLSYSDYRRRYDADFLRDIQVQYPAAYVVPEGGSGEVGLDGFAGLAQELVQQIRELGLEQCVVAVAMGTGTTVAGLRKYLPETISVWGVPVLPQNANESATQQLLGESAQYVRIWHNLVDAKYGQLSDELKTYLDVFEAKHGVQLDPIYTVKLFFALSALAKTHHLTPHQHVIALHSGGLQGRRGFNLPFSIEAAY